MKLRLTKVAAAATLAAALIAAPVAATADEYTPSAATGSVTVAAGGTVTVPFTGFDANESVTFTLTGENGAGATLAFVKTAVSTSAPLTKSANASGAVSVTVTLPSNATGTYTLNAVGAASGAADPVTITAGTAASADADGLAVTGGDSGALLGLWVGGGALVLAGASIAVAGSVRRNRNANAA